MMIDIEQDLEKIKETVALGLNRNQMLYAGSGVLLGFLTILKLYPLVGYYKAFLLSVPVMLPLFLQGFYRFQGLSFFAYIHLLYRFFREREKEFCFEEKEE